MDADNHNLGDIVLYSVSNIYRQGLGLLTAFVRPKLLSPELFGLWSLQEVGRPDTVILIDYGDTVVWEAVEVSIALDRLALLKDLADAEFTHAHWMLTLEGADPLPSMRELLARQLDGVRFVALSVEMDSPVRRIVEEIAGC